MLLLRPLLYVYDWIVIRASAMHFTRCMYDSIDRIVHRHLWWLSILF
jgi:hypothetical protein